MAKLEMLLFVTFVLFAHSINAHSYHWGSCPKIEPVEDFDYNKILGRWFVVQRFSTNSPCWTYNYINQNGTWKVIEARDEIVNETNPDDKRYSTGTFNIPMANRSAAMKVTYPTNIAGSADYTIFATDHENYIGVFECQHILLGYRMSASILSRKLFLEQKYSSKVRAKLASQGIDLHDFNVVEQTSCKYTYSVMPITDPNIYRTSYLN